MRRLRTALLHLVPVTGSIADNRRLIEAGVGSAAARGAHYILTPGLAVCGYEFDAVIGTAWIVPQPDPWMTALGELVNAPRVTVFHEPNGEWEARPLETGLPLIVCNRGGRDRTLDFMGAESIVVAGHRALSAHPDRSVILTCDWDRERRSPCCHQSGR